MPQVFVAAGSNIDPVRNLALAMAELRREFPDLESSPVYRNRAAGFEGDDFLNLVARFTTDLPVRDLLARLHRIEVACGRPRDAPKWAPRAMDLDVLLYGDLVCDTPELRLPRPDLLKRTFMLGPLTDLAPDLVHPTAGRTIAELWQDMDRASHPLVRLPDGVLRA
jgi:2-amino-4-hydroxy-6-hydroxymethyldihydropteridine diphosphokinase